YRRPLHRVPETREGLRGRAGRQGAERAPVQGRLPRRPARADQQRHAGGSQPGGLLRRGPAAHRPRRARSLTMASSAAPGADERPADGRRGTIYTFYSYKGGVGRSMALANVAALLARWGQRVLVLDWDLEAPGLEKYFERPTSRIDGSRETT